MHPVPTGLQVAFKGDYLQLFQAQQITAAELLVAKEALAEATKDAYATEKALAWLTAAHAEERALRTTAKAEAAAAAEQLAKERNAHQAAVARLVAEMEARSKLQIECDVLQGKLREAALAHAEMVAQRDELLQEKNNLEDKCVHVLGDVADLYEALVMEDALDVPPEMREAVDAAQVVDETGKVRARRRRPAARSSHATSPLISRSPPRLADATRPVRRRSSRPAAWRPSRPRARWCAS